VVGTVTGTQERPLGERAYPYVVIRPDQIYLWARDFAYPYTAPFPYYRPWPYY
jgi:starvation-inducible outer membrane lipoprotein